MEPKLESGIYKIIIELMRAKYSNVFWMFDMSGVALSKQTAKKVSGMRSNNGYPDFFILEPRKGFHAFFLEIKRAQNNPYTPSGHFKPKPDSHEAKQRAVLKMLRDRGYYAEFACGVDECIKRISWYLDGKEK